ncbi:hypothetical protein APY03_1461 [Variovorax sp. WDL1]|nr:hypothetical protein APY03_1461 [Variovorax sp. WDL1]
MGSLGWAGDPAGVDGLGKDGGRHAAPACRYWTTARPRRPARASPVFARSSSAGSGQPRSWRSVRDC